MWRDTIELGNLTETIAHGEPIQSMAWRTVFANKKSVKYSEFYQASAAGLKPELVFEIRLVEFSNDEKVRYNGAIYEILRTYEKGETIELTVSKLTGGV